MDLIDYLIGDSFVASIHQLRHSRTGNSASIGKLRDSQLARIHEKFKTMNQIHNSGALKLVNCSEKSRCQITGDYKTCMISNRKL